MLVTANNFFEVTSSNEEEQNIFNIELIPYDKKRNAIIIELKAKDSKSRTSLKSLAKSVINEIDDKKYYTSLQKKFKGIIKIGIAFSNKNVEVVVDGEKDKEENEFKL